MVSEYTLYMDESETFNSAEKKYFVMSGVIIKNSNYSKVENDLNTIKRLILFFKDYTGTFERNTFCTKDK